MTTMPRTALAAAALLLVVLAVTGTQPRDVVAMRAAEEAITTTEAVAEEADRAVTDRQVHTGLVNAISMARGVVTTYGTEYGGALTVDSLEAIPDDLATHVQAVEEDRGRFEATPRGPDARLAAEALAAGHGYTVEWVEATPAGYTGTVADPDDLWVSGYYTPDQPDTIMLSVGWHGPDAIPTSADAVTTTVAVALHEVAHGEIYHQCGTTSPPIAGGDAERVTDAYAVAVLGADPGHRSMYGAHTAHHTDAAVRIAGGECD